MDSSHRIRRSVAGVVLVALAATACSGRADDTTTSGATTSVATTTRPTPGSGGSGGTTSTTTTAPDPCAGAQLATTEIGVTADTITVLVAADVGSPLATGLFQAAFDGVEAWARHVNEAGGLACRQVEVVDFDTLLNANESVNAQKQACDQALAMVGTTALFVFDTETMNTCPDLDGRATGIPDIAQLTTEVAHQCSPTTFPVVAPQGACPYDGGPRLYTERLGHLAWYRDNVTPDLTGVFVVPGDLPSTRQTAITSVRARETLGVVNAGEFAVSGLALQPVYAEFVQALADEGANYAWSGSNFVAMVKWRSEAANQGVDVDIWECTIACYTRQFIEEAGDAAEGTYIPVFSVPFEEADTNPELQAYVEAVSTPEAFGLNAWAAGVMLEEVVNAIVDRDGPNAVTRAAVMAELSELHSFDARGMLGTIDVASRTPGGCFALLQVRDGEFVRVHPAERGTLDCSDSNVVQITVDAAAEAEKLD